MNVNFKYKMIGILILVLCVIVLGSMYYINSSSANTIIVYKETVEDKIVKNGIITAEQFLINAQQSGATLFNCEEGKLITPHVKIATVYSGAIDENAKEMLRGLNDKIVFAEANEKNKKNIIGDIPSISRDINSAISLIIEETNENNYENVYKIKNEITSYNKKLMELKGEKIQVAEENIQDEISKLENSLNATKHVYTSPVNGMFSTKVTNFDTLLDPKKAVELTPGDFADLYKTEIEEYKSIEAGKPFCKIINHYEWFIVSEFTLEELSDLKVGEHVGIRVINNSDSKVDGVIYNISQPEDDKVVVVIKSTKNLDNIWTSNKVEFELVKRTRTGFKIPVSSIIEKDDVKGVYVIKGSVYKFVEIEPLLYDDNFVLIRDRSADGHSESNNVILYDYVVVNPENIVEGNFA